MPTQEELLPLVETIMRIPVIAYGHICRWPNCIPLQDLDKCAHLSNENQICCTTALAIFRWKITSLYRNAPQTLLLHFSQFLFIANVGAARITDCRLLLELDCFASHSFGPLRFL